MRYAIVGLVAMTLVGACSSAATTAPTAPPASVAPASVAPASVAPASVAPASVAPASVAPSPSAAMTQLRFALIEPVSGIPFTATMDCGAIEAAKQYNVTMVFEGAAQSSVQTQTQAMQAVMQTKPDALILSPDDATALLPTVQSIISGGTPFASLDLSLAQPLGVANFRPDPLALGAQAADQLATAAPKGGPVLVIGWAPGVVANQQRADGFIKEMKAKYPQFQVLPEQFVGLDQNKAAQVTAATLTAHPDLVGIFTTHGIGASGAEAAVINAKLQGTVKIIAMDADPAEVQGIKDGTYFALAAQPPFLEGYGAVKLLAEVVRQQVDPATVKYQQFLPGAIITKANVDSTAVKPFLYASNTDAATCDALLAASSPADLNALP